MNGLDFRPRHKRRPTLNVTSLIDVLFLLLIFIMVSSTFVEHPAIELDLPRAASAQGVPVEPMTLALTADGKLFLDGEEVDGEALLARLEEAVAADPDVVVNLRGDRTVDYGLVIEAIDIAKQAGVRKLSAFTELGPADPRE